MIDALPQGALGTFAALLLAHVLADFIFQTDAMVARKRERHVFLCHIAIVFAATLAALGGAWTLALAVTAAHLIIDAIKIWAIPERYRESLSVFLLDQAAHLATLVLAALLWPFAFAPGIWAGAETLLLAPAITLSGLILTVLVGGYAVGKLTARFQSEMSEDGLPDAGRLIGQLERALIFLFVLIDQPAGIGFLIAAKSILRFDTAKEDQKASEYVIVGTLASFGWALATSIATMRLLEIAALSP